MRFNLTDSLKPSFLFAMCSTALEPECVVEEPQLQRTTAEPQATKTLKRAVWYPSVRSTYCINPLSDPRWDAFLSQHPRASVFHSSRWLSALFRTYGYRPIAYTTSPKGADLENALVFCRVESWLTGHRLVSLPFSDHCEPLVDQEDDWKILTAVLEREAEQERWRYIELRPLRALALKTSLRSKQITYNFHQLDLAIDLDTLFHNFHKSSTQRKIRRAEREGLVYQEGRTRELLEQFYELKKRARAKHHLPPQPMEWFVNLAGLFGEDLKVRISYRNGRPIAAMLTLRYKDTMVYKYGGSDPRFNNLGGMHLLFWTAIQEAKASGLRFFDFGRTDEHQSGLITFKGRWGAKHSTLRYARYGTSKNVSHPFDLQSSERRSKIVKFIFSHLHPSVLSAIGRLAYRHIG